MANGRFGIALSRRVYIYPDRTVEINPGDVLPPIVELDGMAESLDGGPVFESTEVPVKYVHYYMDKIQTCTDFSTTIRR